MGWECKYNWENTPQNKKATFWVAFVLWELTDSNRRPSACKADALNQLS